MDNSDQLKRAIQALAQPASVQIALFPNFVAVGDELAIDYGEALDQFTGSSATGLTSQQCAALKRLDDEINRWSGQANEELWLNRELLETDARWNTIRLYAVAVLDAMGWPNDRPEPGDAIYVQGPKQN